LPTFGPRMVCMWHLRSLAVWQCNHEAVLSADHWPDHMPVPGVWAAHRPGLFQAVRQL
jgi:hypothetical protein